jgi:hypothetical protein
LEEEMTVYDDTAIVEAPISLVWQEAYKLARKGRIQREEVNSIIFATSLKLGYVYLMKAQPDGTTFLRHVIDTAGKVGEALESNQDPWQALDALDTLTDTPTRETAGTFSKILQSILALIGFGEAGELMDTSYIRDTGKAQLSRVKIKSERAAK